jgi:uncharacterized beta-barrel protein YwiB (DUF1934 family)
MFIRVFNTKKILYVCGMKKSLFISLTLSILSFTACEESDLSINFDLNQADIEFTLSAADVVNSNGETVEISTPAKSTLTGDMEQYADKLDKVESAKLSTLRVSIVAPTTPKFSFVKEVKFYITGTGIPETLVGSKSNIDATASSVDLDIEDVELVKFIRSGEVSTRVSFMTDEGIDEDCDMKAEMTYTIRANAL